MSLFGSFDIRAAARSLRWPTVAQAALEAYGAAFLGIGGTDLLRGSSDEITALVLSAPFLIAVARLGAMLLPVTLLGHLVVAFWKGGRRSPITLHATDPQSSAAWEQPAEDEAGELALVLRPDGSVQVVPGVLGGTLGPDQLVVWLEQGASYEGIPFETWREHLYNGGTVTPRERRQGRLDAGLSRSDHAAV